MSKGKSDKRIQELEAEVERLQKKVKDLEQHDIIRESFIRCIGYAVLDPNFNDIPSCNLMGRSIFAAIRRLHQLAMK